MGYPMINKFRRAITFGKAIRAWYRVPIGWDDTDWHIIVRPPSRFCVAIQEIDFHGDGAVQCHMHMAYQQGGSFFEFDHVESYYEHGFRSYVQTFILPANAEFVVRRAGATPVISGFSARGYFIRPAGAGTQRIATDYGTYTYGAP